MAGVENIALPVSGHNSANSNGLYRSEQRDYRRAAENAESEEKECTRIMHLSLASALLRVLGVSAVSHVSDLPDCVARGLSVTSSRVDVGHGFGYPDVFDIPCPALQGWAVPLRRNSNRTQRCKRSSTDGVS